MLRNERAIFSRYWYAFLSDRSSRGRDVAVHHLHGGRLRREQAHPEQSHSEWREEIERDHARFVDYALEHYLDKAKSIHSGSMGQELGNTLGNNWPEEEEDPFDGGLRLFLEDNGDVKGFNFGFAAPKGKAKGKGKGKAGASTKGDAGKKGGKSTKTAAAPPAAPAASATKSGTAAAARGATCGTSAGWRLCPTPGAGVSE